jgi:hypothetical protein
MSVEISARHEARECQSCCGGVVLPGMRKSIITFIIIIIMIVIIIIIIIIIVVVVPGNDASSRRKSQEEQLPFRVGVSVPPHTQGIPIATRRPASARKATRAAKVLLLWLDFQPGPPLGFV